MKRFFFGLLTGALLGGAAYFIVIPKVKQSSYDSGFNDGNKKGIVTGTTAGIGQGIAQIKAEQQHERDSLAVIEKNKELALQAAATKARKVVKPIQNWHVINGHIADPVIDAKPDTHATTAASKS